MIAYETQQCRIWDTYIKVLCLAFSFKLSPTLLISQLNVKLIHANEPCGDVNPFDY